MPAELTALIEAGKTDALAASAALLNAANYIGYAGNAIEANNWVNANFELTRASQALILANKKLWQADFWYQGFMNDWYDALYWINDNWTGGGAGVTMDEILTAMISAEFEQLQKFIGISDAYKVAIWNAPFNQDFYAALARGFAQWQQS